VFPLTVSEGRSSWFLTRTVISPLPLKAAMPSWSPGTGAPLERVEPFLGDDAAPEPRRQVDDPTGIRDQLPETARLRYQCI
jgi:hypothetical protein